MGRMKELAIERAERGIHPTSLTVWDKERVLALLEANDKAVIRALECLYNRQTSEERTLGQNVEHNGRGFTSYDADLLTSFVEFYRNAGFLTQKQLAVARKKLAKYWRQLLEEIEAKGQQVSYKVLRK